VLLITEAQLPEDRGQGPKFQGLRQKVTNSELNQTVTEYAEHFFKDVLSNMT